MLQAAAGRATEQAWNGPSSPPSAPLTFKDGTALALSCMADYGAPVFPFLAVGGYRGKPGGREGHGSRRVEAVMGFSLPGGGRAGSGWREAADPPVLPPFTAASFVFARAVQILWLCAWAHRPGLWLREGSGM